MSRTDPYGNFKFQVEIAGVTVAGFTEVNGLCAEVEIIEYREGQDPNTVIKLPGRTTYSNVILKWGITGNLDLWNWFNQVVVGNLERRNVVVRLLNLQGVVVMRWHIHNAWPVKWKGATLSATGNEIAIETLELTHEGFDIET